MIRRFVLNRVTAKGRKVARGLTTITHVADTDESLRVTGGHLQSAFAIISYSVGAANLVSDRRFFPLKFIQQTSHRDVT